MEPVSAISEITSLFTTIIQGVGYIQLVRSFEDDLKVHQLRLNLIQLRLSRWGEAAGLAVADHTADRERANPLVQENADQIEDLLQEIKTVLENGQRESEKLAPKEPNHGQDPPADPDNDISPSRFKRLRIRIQNIIQKRCLRSGDHFKGVKWILYKKEQCEALTTQLGELIDQLEQYAPPDKLEELSREDSKEMSDSLTTLLEIIGTVDPRLEHAVTQKLDADRASRGVHVSAITNNGLQIGVNYGEFKGTTLGTGNTITHQWKG